MTYITYGKNGQPRVDKVKAFCELLNNRIPSPKKSFLELVYEMDEKIRHEPKISREALSNAHGDWYEWLLALAAWSYGTKNPKAYVAVLLPNIKRFDVSNLYQADLYDLVLDLRQKVEKSASVKLITSNPDFVIIDDAAIDVESPYQKKLDSLNEDTIAIINKAYEKYISKCTYEAVAGYMAAKFSFRPDRRLQIPHEGSLMKAIYAHLQTRKWIISPKGIKYYALSAKVGRADEDGLRTVATHSITTVHDVPYAAVDGVYKVDSINEAWDIYNKILQPYS